LLGIEDIEGVFFSSRSPLARDLFRLSFTINIGSWLSAWPLGVVEISAIFEQLDKWWSNAL
jgi:hypothetical protein